MDLLNESGYTRLQKIQYMLANGGRSIISALINAAYIKFYTDFIGLDAKWLGIVFLIFTVWAALNDPIFGLWVDRRPYRKGLGKYRPVLIRSFPLLIFTTLVFPWASPDWSQLAISIYLFFALILWESALTMFVVSYNAVSVNLFLTTAERAEIETIENYIGLLSVFGSSIPIMILSMDVNRTTMLIFFGIVALASGLLMWASVPQIREREGFYENDTDQALPFKEFLKATGDLLKNRAFLLFFLTFFFMQSLVNNYLLGYSYFYDNLVLSKGLWTGLPDILIGIMAAIMFPIVFKWIRQHGTKLVLSRMMLVALAGYILLVFVPGTKGAELQMATIFGVEVPAEASYWLTTLIYFLIYFGFVGVFMTNSPIQRRLIDHLEIETGHRRPATIGGIIGVLLTPGNAFLVFVYTQIISYFGYDGATKIQSANAQLGIRLATGLMPAIMIGLGLFFLAKYPINKDEEDRIEKEILARHTTH